MKLAPVVFVFRYYFTDNFNEGEIALQSSDLAWMSCIVFTFFLSDQIYVYMKQRIDEHLLNSRFSQSLLIQQRDVSKNESLVNHACNSKLLDLTDRLKLYDLNQDSFKNLEPSSAKDSPLKLSKNHAQSVPSPCQPIQTNEIPENLFLQDLMGLIP